MIEERVLMTACFQLPGSGLSLRMLKVYDLAKSDPGREKTPPVEPEVRRKKPVAGKES
jgi:hypothetical protein